VFSAETHGGRRRHFSDSDRLKEQEAKMEKAATQIEMSTLGLQIAQLP
jgi:hypothetical protein